MVQKEREEGGGCEDTERRTGGTVVSRALGCLPWTARSHSQSPFHYVSNIYI